jgi:hypothetical protein
MVAAISAMMNSQEKVPTNRSILGDIARYTIREATSINATRAYRSN